MTVALAISGGGVENKEETVIDENGFRANVGIIIADGQGRVLWAKRLGQDGWQFPQGGINEGESAEQAMYRELGEEVGLCKDDVRVIAQTRGWLRYRLPKSLQRQNSKPLCIGQKQKWFLLKLTCSSDKIDLKQGDTPEFDDWQWAGYWYPINKVVNFKRDVYRRALKELSGSHCRLVSMQTQP